MSKKIAKHTFSFKIQVYESSEHISVCLNFPKFTKKKCLYVIISIMSIFFCICHKKRMTIRNRYIDVHDVRKYEQVAIYEILNELAKKYLVFTIVSQKLIIGIVSGFSAPIILTLRLSLRSKCRKSNFYYKFSYERLQ